MVDAAHPLLGRTLSGRFRLLGVIGEGAMATVFRAVDISRQDPFEVAVKVMHPHLADDRTFSGRFRREAQATRMLKHANSVAIFEVGEDERVHFIAMELVPGRDLRHVLRSEGRLDEMRAVRILVGVVEALEAAHQIGIIHRDLKPENVMIVPDPTAAGRERVKVLDFGIAKLLDGGPHSRPSLSPDSEPQPLTQVGVVVGTPAYMSPEQCRGLEVDGRSDLYTCGILLYQLVTGRLPFESDSPFEVAGKQAFEPPPPPSQFLPTIFPRLEALIVRLLSKIPDERPASATVLLGQLRDLYAELSARAGRTMPMSAQTVQAALAAAAPQRPGRTQMLEPGAGLPDPRLSVESVPVQTLGAPPHAPFSEGPYAKPGAYPGPPASGGPSSFGPGSAPYSGQALPSSGARPSPISMTPGSRPPSQPAAVPALPGPMPFQPAALPVPMQPPGMHAPGAMPPAPGGTHGMGLADLGAQPGGIRRAGDSSDRIVLPKRHGAGAYLFGLLVAIGLGIGAGIALARYLV